MAAPENGANLRRVLTLWDLIFYGVILISPLAPVGVFGIAAQTSRGHVVLTILVAMAAMMLTAFSYGRMSVLYPAAGSAYTYVGRGLNPHLGFLIGWVMLLDFLLIPVINVVYVSLTTLRLAPQVPYLALAALTTLTITILNLRGIRATARVNKILLVAMSLVILCFIVAAVRYILGGAEGWGGLIDYRAIYDPQTFNLNLVATATSLAALTYIGFDGVTTLAEETKNPSRTVPLATVLVCFFVGLLSALEVYLAIKVWPDYQTFVNPETAFLDVSARAGGAILFQAMAVILVVACLGSGLAGQVGAARLLFGMSRDGVLPFRRLARLDAGGSPTRGIILVGILTFLGAAFLSYELSASLLNFGAFLAFMGVNLAAIKKYYFEGQQQGRRRNFIADALCPGVGFLFCLGIWLSLPTPSKVAGGAWLLAGVLYSAVKTKGFRARPSTVNFSAD